MSFYLGKDNNGTSILHMTNTTNSKQELKEGLLDSTTFHSSLPYIRWEEVPIISKVLLNAWTGWALTELIIDPTVAALIGTNDEAYVFVCDGTTYVYPPRYYNDDGVVAQYGYWTGSTYGNVAAEPSTTYNKIYLAYHYTTVKMYRILNITKTKYIEEIPSDSSILISNNSFTVNGTSLAEFKYISRGILNNLDATALLYGTSTSLQFISPISGNFSLYTDENSQTISTGGKVLYSSLFSNNMRYVGVYTLTIPQRSWASNGEQHSTYTFSHGLPLGDYAYYILGSFGSATAGTSINTGKFINSDSPPQGLLFSAQIIINIMYQHAINITSISQSGFIVDNGVYTIKWAINTPTIELKILVFK